jgi:hypothetical protein
MFNFFNIISQLSHRILFMFLSSNFSSIITRIVSRTWCCLLVAELQGSICDGNVITMLHYITLKPKYYLNNDAVSNVHLFF